MWKIIGALARDKSKAGQPKQNGSIEDSKLSIEKILGQSTQLLIETLNNLQDGIFALDTNWNFTYLNKRAAGIVNLKPQDIVGKNLWKDFPQVKGTALEENYLLAMQSQQVRHFETKSLGAELWFDITVYPSKEGVIVHWNDITENKKAQEALNESEERLNMAQKIAHVGSWEYFAKEDKAVWSEELFNIFGLTPQRYGPDVNSYVKLIYPNDREKINTEMEKLLFEAKVGNRTSFDYRILLPDNCVRILHSERVVREVENGKATRIMGIEQDITEHKQAEEALIAAKENLQNILNSIDDGVTLVALDGKIIDTNESSLKQVGLTKEEFVGKNVYDMVAPEDKQRAIEGSVKVLETGKTTNQVRILRKDGSAFFAEISVTALYDKNKKPTAFLGVTRDISERKKAEETLKESEERFRLVAEAAKVLVYEANVSTGKVKVIRGLEELVGFKPDEIDFGIDWALNRIHPDDVANVLEHYKEALQVNGAESYTIQYRFLHKNGKYITVQNTAKAVRDRYGKATRIIGGVVDVSELVQARKELEQYSKHLEDLVEKRTKQLQEKERLAAVGETAGMVGHDLRNPLQSVIGEVYLAESELKAISDSAHKDCVHDSIQAIAEQIGYMDKIVSDLQTFVKPVEPIMQVVKLRPLIAAVLAQTNIAKNIHASMEVPHVLTVEADPQLLKRVLINLVTNAVQAMSQGGELTITAQAKSEGQAQIIVEDTGVGIPEEIKPKLFTPLFTTKSKGQGFGLAVCKRVLEAQGGTISFESQEGKGTKFIVELPTK